MKSIQVVALVGAFSLLISTQSPATQLDLVPVNGGADFSAWTMGVTYSDQTFQAIAGPTGESILEYNHNFLDPVDFYGDFALTATITPAGVLTAGSLTVNGDIGSGQQTLLTADLNTGADGIAFGSHLDPSSPNSATIFEFRFTVTGGDPTIVSDFGGNGGLILSAYFDSGVGDTPFTGSWTSDFSNNSSKDAYADTMMVVPEPSSLLLLLVGGVMCAATLRVRRKRA
jgi:hypothetical protein